jgi:uncharacterized membrane protein YebE (DUF533 family)
MEANEIIMNEEVMEVAEEYVPAGSGNCLKIFGGVVALAGLAYGGYRLWKRRKSKKDMLVVPATECAAESDEECSDEE